jgi:Concanavalin A-like lectin/glucanases superfamily
MAIDNFKDEVFADVPDGYWRLGDPVGTTATDSSGNGNTGACTGGVTFQQPGFHGGDTAALFDGATGRIVIRNSNSLNSPYITMEAKFRWDGPNGLQQRILEKSSYPEVAQYGMSVDSVRAGYLLVELRTPSGVKAYSNSVVSQGVETHAVATYDGAWVKIYINGMLDSETPASGPIDQKPPTSDNLIESGVGIGNQTQRDRPFKGLIDEVAVYSTPLSADRILAHFKSQFAASLIFQYAAKFVCGKSPGRIVAPGVYYTAVNVHNPLYRGIDLRVKVAVALPELKPGSVSKFQDAKLGPDEALEIDCPDIRTLAESKDEFLKGFVVIESNVELDVVAVYTASGKEETVETLHTERVPARRRMALPAG